MTIEYEPGIIAFRDGPNDITNLISEWSTKRYGVIIDVRNTGLSSPWGELNRAGWKAFLNYGIRTDRVRFYLKHESLYLSIHGGEHNTIQFPITNLRRNEFGEKYKIQPVKTLMECLPLKINNRLVFDHLLPYKVKKKNILDESPPINNKAYALDEKTFVRVAQKNYTTEELFDMILDNEKQKHETAKQYLDAQKKKVEPTVHIIELEKYRRLDDRVANILRSTA